MQTRQLQLLNLVIDSYIKTAEPIGSRFLLAKGKLDVGEATVRNDLRALEDDGYLTHPHTSAGRIPTEKGYLAYLADLDMSKAKLSKKDNDVFGMCLKDKGITNKEQSDKELVKALAELSDETVILAFSPDKVYYTGLSNLFSKPEFQELQLVADVSQIFDHCEDCLKTFFDNVGAEPKYFVGAEHSFGNALSVLAFRFGDDSLLALLGPMRMNYARNFGLVNKVKELL
ncbi:MAG: winged-helix domain-containing protein [Candidatus Magasanikbacteria bacterium]|jgi:heat-inducible transcriptional repressor